jgi:hypothetical protein
MRAPNKTGLSQRYVAGGEGVSPPAGTGALSEIKRPGFAAPVEVGQVRAARNRLRSVAPCPTTARLRKGDLLA